MVSVRQKKVRVSKCQSLLNLFQLRVPDRQKGRDGRMYDIFYRVGPMGGAFTKKELMEREGMMAELAEVQRDANKRYKKSTDVQMVVSSREAYLKRLLESRMSLMKAHIQKDAEKQGLVPLASMVRIHSEDEERRFFIQGFANSEGDLVIGSRDDAALWAIEMMSVSKPMARRYRLAHKVGEKLSEKGLLSGPVRDRLSTTLKA